MASIFICVWLQEKSCRMEVCDLGMDSIGPGASDRNAGSGAQVQENKSGTVIGLMVDRWGGPPPWGSSAASWAGFEWTLAMQYSRASAVKPPDPDKNKMYKGCRSRPRAGTDWTEGVWPKARTRNPPQTPTVQSVPALGLPRDSRGV